MFAHAHLTVTRADDAGMGASDSGEDLISLAVAAEVCRLLGNLIWYRPTIRTQYSNGQLGDGAIKSALPGSTTPPAAPPKLRLQY